MGRRKGSKDTDATTLSRRERQIMDIVYRRGEVSVREVLEELPDAPSYSSVRALIRILEEKGHLAHREDGVRYLFSATVPRDEARESALRRVMSTFFENSAEKAVAALLDLSGEPLSHEELDRLVARIEQAKEERKA